VVTKEEVINILKTIYDPEIPIDIYNLGLVYEIKVEDGVVYIKMTFTTPACPMVNYVVQEVVEKVKKLQGVKDVKVELVWDPPWSPEMISEEYKKKLLG
jgi:FeS assembly SUF system protein